MDGIILINKEKGYTSHDVVAKVKGILKAKKIGHTGTLDPNATGVLPLLINKGTELSKYLINHDKTYEVVLKLGIKTDTADSEGTILQQEDSEKIDKILQSEDIEKILEEMVGRQKQIPPMYSAIKVKGKKLYEYARMGKEVEVPEREIEIYYMQLLGINKDEVSFKVECSKGTYIRSLCEEIARRLGTIGYMKELCRTKVGEFGIEEAISIQELEQHKEEEEYWKMKCISFEDIFQEAPKVIVTIKEETKFLNGVKLPCKEMDGICIVYTEENKLMGTGIVQKNFLKRDVILENK